MALLQRGLTNITPDEFSEEMDRKIFCFPQQATTWSTFANKSPVFVKPCSIGVPSCWRQFLTMATMMFPPVAELMDRLKFKILPDWIRTLPPSHLLLGIIPQVMAMIVSGLTWQSPLPPIYGRSGYIGISIEDPPV